MKNRGKKFESHGFHTLGLLKYLHSVSIDAFFLSTDTTVGRKCILESKNKAIVHPESKRTLLRPLKLSQRLNNFSGKNCYAPSSHNSQMLSSNLLPLPDISPPTIATTLCNTTESSIAAGQENKPLDRQRNKMKDNLPVLEVQITSASGK